MLLRRLVIAFALSVAAAVLCWLILPRFNVPMPWWVPILAFVVIAIPSVLTSIDWTPREPDESPQAIDTDFPPVDRD